MNAVGGRGGCLVRRLAAYKVDCMVQAPISFLGIEFTLHSFMMPHVQVRGGLSKLWL